MKLIAGPCVIEDWETLDEIAKHLDFVVEGKNIDFYFKASCIKDNRTKIENYTGPGMDVGIRWLMDIKAKYGLKVTTDFHNEIDIMRYGGFVDLIQIPAYLAQQTSLIKAAAGMNKPIHIKKPQFLGPLNAEQPYKKLKDLNFNKEIMMTDRGTMFGYNMTIFDPRHIVLLKDHDSNMTVLVDVTHPNKNYPDMEVGGGYKSLYSLVLARSAIASGADGIFLETHPKCSKALCDGGTMLPLDDIDGFIADIYDLWEYFNDMDG